MRAMPSLTSRTVPTSSTSSSWRSAASISRRRMSLISPGRSVVSVAILSGVDSGRSSLLGACEKYHKHGKRANPGSRNGRRVARKNAADRASSHLPRVVSMTDGRAVGRMFRTMGLGLRDLRVWQEAVGLGAEVIRSMRQTNRREIKAITEHTMLTAIHVAENVAEGYGRYAAGEQRQLYRAAKRELLRLETSLAVAR